MILFLCPFFQPIIIMVSLVIWQNYHVSFLFLCTTLPQPWWLNTIPFISSQMCTLEWASLCFMLKAKIMVLALISRKESTLKADSCWQNSVFCGCRSKVPVSLLEVSHGPRSIPQGHHNPSHFTPFIFKQTMVRVLLGFHVSLTFFFCYQPEEAPFFYRLMWLDQTDLDNLPISRALDDII